MPWGENEKGREDKRMPSDIAFKGTEERFERILKSKRNKKEEEGRRRSLKKRFPKKSIRGKEGIRN